MGSSVSFLCPWMEGQQSKGSQNLELLLDVELLADWQQEVLAWKSSKWLLPMRKDDCTGKRPHKKEEKGKKSYISVNRKLFSFLGKMKVHTR